MWWLMFVLGVIAFAVFGMLYLELRPARHVKKFDPTLDSATNQQILHAQANSTRNQTSMLW